MMGGGNARGSTWLPEVDDEVLVAFEQGDIRRPYVIGGLNNGVDVLAVGSATVIDGTSGKIVAAGTGVEERSFLCVLRR